MKSERTSWSKMKIFLFKNVSMGDGFMSFISNKNSCLTLQRVVEKIICLKLSKLKPFFG